MESRVKITAMRKKDDGLPIEDDDVIVVDEEMNVLQKTKISDKLMQERNGMELLQQKADLVEEVQRLNRESNMKREVVLKLIGLLRSMDPLFLETKEKAEIVRKKLYGLKKGVKDDENLRKMFMEIGLDGNQFFETGSQIKKDTHKHIINTLKTKNLDYSRDVAHRSLGYSTQMSRYRDKLRENIFAEKELFKKTRIGKNDKLQQDFSKMNQGIDNDHINPITYTTRRLDGDTKDHEIALDSEVAQVFTEDQGAERKFAELMNKTGKENNRLSIDEIKAKRANPQTWKRPFDYLPEHLREQEPELKPVVSPTLSPEPKQPPHEDEIILVDDIDLDQKGLLTMESDDEKKATPKKEPEPIKEEPKVMTPTPPPPVEEPKPTPPAPPVEEPKPTPPAPPVEEPIQAPPPPPPTEPLSEPPKVEPPPPPPLLLGGGNPEPPKEEPKVEPPKEMALPPPSLPGITPSTPPPPPPLPVPPKEVTLEEVLQSKSPDEFQKNLGEYTKDK